MEGVGIGGQGGPQWGPSGIGCSYEVQKVGWWGGLPGLGGPGGEGVRDQIHNSRRLQLCDEAPC